MDFFLSDPRRILYVWLLLMSLVLFFTMGADKRRAVKSLRRVPERRLFTLALLGGAAGGWLGMYAFRHKTKHWYFQYGMPAILLIQVVLCVFLVKLLVPT